MNRTRRPAVALVIVSTASVLTALGGAASPAVAALAASSVRSVPAAGIKGDPQPELKPFEISSTDGNGTISMEPDGSLVAVYNVSGGDGRTRVCQLKRTGTKCTATVTLTPLDDDSVNGVPQVFVTSADHVSVLQSACCDADPNGDVLFDSANGGSSFGAAVRVGSIDASVATLSSGEIAFTEGDTSAGTLVESVPFDASGPPPIYAQPNSKIAADVGIGNFGGGVLVGADDAGSPDTTYVEYAAPETNFDSSGSYVEAGAFSKSELIGISGGALLTENTTGKDTVELRMFGGVSFGAAHAVPGTSGGGPEWFAVYQDPSGAVHVFSERGKASPGYDLIEESTSDGGARWSAPVDLGDAITNNFFSVALDRHGAGLVLGTGGGKAYGYPVLAPQTVSFALKSGSIGVGHSTTASGKVSPVGKGRKVFLQVERSGLWYTVATAHESSTGTFSFTIKGSSAGTFDYRAVVNDQIGYLMYGYSAARTLQVTG